MTSIDKIYKLFIENPVITTDSRNVPANSIFWALQGETFDGNKFAHNAIESGAKIAVVDDPSIISDKVILVENSLVALQKLATIHRQALGLKVLAITGSNGKTTTKELINAVLSTKFNVFATKGNLNNHIGVPLTLLSVTPTTDIAIIEMGANHPGEIAALADIALPDYGLITNIGSAHLEGFGSFEGVIKTKGELYQNISRNNGKVFFNSLNPILQDLIKIYNLEENSIPYGLNQFTISNNQNEKSPFLSIMASFKSEQKVKLNTNLVGDYNLENVFAAMTIGSYFSVPIADIKSAIENYIPTNSRSQLVKTNYNSVILDAYNANPTSMMASLKNLSSINHQSKVAIVGAMKEMGIFADLEHKRIVEYAKSLDISKIILVGKEFDNTNTDFLIFETAEDLKKYLKENQIKDSLVLVKGSRAVKLEVIMDYL